MSRLDGRDASGDYCGFANTTSWTAWSGPNSGVTCAANTWYLWTIVINGGQVADYYNTGLTNIGAAGTQINALSSTYSTTAGTITYANDGSYIGLQGDGGSGTTYWQGIIVRAVEVRQENFCSIVVFCISWAKLWGFPDTFCA